MHHNYTYDLFISHAVEDKIPLVNELAAQLEAQGIKVWYTGCELSMGDAVCDTLVHAMRQCRYGIIVFSPSYISKMKPSSDFNTLLNYKRQGEKVIIPVLFEVTPEELVTAQLLSEDHNAIDSSEGVNNLVTRLLQRIDLGYILQQPTHISLYQKLTSGKSKVYAALLLAIGIVLLLYGFSILLT